MTEGEEKENAADEEAPTVSDAEVSEENPVLSNLEQLQAALEAQQKVAKEAEEKYLRTLADHENYKKRMQKDQLDQIKYANERLIKEALPVIDNLERAITHSTETHDFDKMVEGVTMIHKQLLTVLDKFGVRPIECLNQAFDPFHHQSVGQVETEADSDIGDNEIVTEAQKGYFLNDKVLRPSLVMVAKKKQAPMSEREEISSERGD